MAPKPNGIPKTFPQSRIPVYFLLDYIEDGYSISEFQSSYPWIKREDILFVLTLLKKQCESSYKTK